VLKSENVCERCGETVKWWVLTNADKGKLTEWSESDMYPHKQATKVQQTDECIRVRIRCPICDKLNDFMQQRP